jgi:putative ATP-binding cassette transporter
MNLISILFKTSWRRVLGAALASVASGLSIAAMLALINTALARAGSAQEKLAWGFAGLCVLVLVSRVLSATLLLRLSQDTLAALRMHLSRQILAAPLHRLEQAGKHRLLAALTDDVTIVAEIFHRLPLLCMNGAIVTGCLAYLGWMSWQLLLATLALLALGVGAFLLQQKGAFAALERSRAAGDDLHLHLRALTDGVKELQLHQPKREAFLTGALGPTLDRVRRHFVAGMTVLLAAESWASMLFLMLVGLVLFAVPALVPVDSAVLGGYALVLLYMRGPFEGLVVTLPDLGQSRIALARIERLRAELQQDGAPALAHVPSPLAVAGAPFHGLELAGVTHAYHRELEERSFTLGPIDLALRPGELVFLIGGNGSGKTTLAKLLLGLYAPESGQVRINGAAVDAAGREAYRQHFSAIYADFYLFDDLPGDGTPEAAARAQQYLERLQLAHKVRIDGGRFSTTALSQGQRKRLALLSAYLEDRPVYLFDEWAADQDPVFKRVFYTELLPDLRARGKAVFVITHDDQYFHLADRCLKLEDGQLSDLHFPRHATLARA